MENEKMNGQSTKPESDSDSSKEVKEVASASSEKYNYIKAKQIIAGESQELIDLRDPKD